MIKTVILDLGNVLAFHDNEQLFEAMAQAFGSSREAMRARLDGGLWHDVNTGKLPGDALLDELNRRLGATVSSAEWFRVWNCHFSINHPMVRAVERLVGRVRLVLLSNTHDQHVAFLRPQLPILERFDGLVLSYEVGAVKPDAAIYARALTLAEAPADHCVFFDDVERYATGATHLGVHGRVFTTVEQFETDLAAFGIAL